MATSLHPTLATLGQALPACSDHTLQGTPPLATDLVNLTTTHGWHLARRVAIAANAGLADEIDKAGPAAWLENQLNPETIDDSATEAMIVKYLPMATMTLAQMTALYGGDAAFTGAARMQTAAQAASALLLRSLWTKRHLAHHLHLFWLDHFSVPFINISKTMNPAAVQLDLAMRPLALTTYREILLRMYSLSTMHYYLDTTANTVKGINQNLARETLELYSVGVGNFTEPDVQSLSILLSGFGQGLTSYFVPDPVPLTDGAHMFTPSVTIRGRQYPNATHDQVIASLKQVLTDLAADPKTARFVCLKLARRFVTDSPSNALVDSLAASYQSSGGSIKAILRTLFASAEFLSSVGHKWRRPDELFLSLIVAHNLQFAWPTFADPQVAKLYACLPRTRSLMEQAGMPFRGWVPPNGFPDTAPYWMGTGPLVKWLNHVDLIWKDLNWYPASDSGWDWVGTWAESLAVDPTSSFSATAARIVERLTGFTNVPPAFLTTVVASLGGGTMPPNPAAPIGTTAKVDLAVRTVLTSPLFFLR